MHKRFFIRALGARIIYQKPGSSTADTRDSFTIVSGTKDMFFLGQRMS